MLAGARVKLDRVEGSAQWRAAAADAKRRPDAVVSSSNLSYCELWVVCKCNVRSVKGMEANLWWQCRRYMFVFANENLLIDVTIDVAVTFGRGCISAVSATAADSRRGGAMGGAASGDGGANAAEV